ncbi:MAG TPA: ferredoxin [Pseudonocardiaceae bacterium]|jgi:Ni,Fe-hydrogenase III small subunit/ferredoxin|nr:ferredoxin [Pseudonocardiaceae bacterium]
MLEWIFRGLRNGILTTRYPRQPDPYAESFAAAVEVIEPAAPLDLAELCPTSAISRSERDTIRLDRGKCILCGRCVDHWPDVFAWAKGSETARLARPTLVVPEDRGDGSADAGLADLRADLTRRVRRLRRSVHIRHVDAGSDGADEWEVAALTNPVYDVHRLGIFFTASPRHADILLVTGAGAHGMTQPLARTLEAMPEPTVVIAVGTDAISGGLLSTSYATAGGVSHQLSVDVWVPGSPASPFTILHGILLALDRVPESRS